MDNDSTVTRRDFLKTAVRRELVWLLSAESRV